MSYKVVIRKNATGETQTCPITVPWGEASHFWWTDGNMGCDCNRHLEFHRAQGIELTDNISCGEEQYTALHAILEDGTVVAIDSKA